MQRLPHAFCTHHPCLAPGCDQPFTSLPSSVTGKKLAETMAPKVSIEKRPAGSEATRGKRDASTVAKGELVTFLTRVKDGRFKKRARPDEQQEAADHLTQYNSLAQEDKAAFALAYSSNKDKKDFQWARDFLQKVKVAKTDEVSELSKYMTRTFISVFEESNGSQEFPMRLSRWQPHVWFWR